jgi:hypothetical protein
MTVNFIVVARTRTESTDGTIYQVRLKSKEGHRLILRFRDEEGLHGFALGQPIYVEIKNPQKTLKET